MSTATAAMSPAMTAQMEPLARRESTPPVAHRGAPPWQDWLFERTTMFFALFVLFTLVGIIGALAWAAVLPSKNSVSGSSSATSGTR